MRAILVTALVGMSGGAWVLGQAEPPDISIAKWVLEGGALATLGAVVLILVWKGLPMVERVFASQIATLTAQQEAERAARRREMDDLLASHKYDNERLCEVIRESVRCEARQAFMAKKE